MTVWASATRPGGVNRGIKTARGVRSSRQSGLWVSLSCMCFGAWCCVAATFLLAPLCPGLSTAPGPGTEERILGFQNVRAAVLGADLRCVGPTPRPNGSSGERLHSPSLCSSRLSCRTKARAGSSQRQHQSAAKDLTLSPEVSNPATIQVTYLPSSQKSKRAKHFLELKSFKDNYNTLESTL